MLVIRCRAWLVVLVLVLPSWAASAFEARAHVLIANETLQAVEAGALSTIAVRSFGRLPLENSEAAAALHRFPSYFRAGALGPDAFPDPVEGRVNGHANKGNRDGLPSDACRQVSGCVPGDVPFEERTFDQWRPIDYGMLLLRRALAFRRGDGAPAAVDEHKQAVAFAYGYLAHLVADEFGDAWADDWVRSASEPAKAKGVFGADSDALQRLAVEEYLEASVPPLRADAEAGDETRVDVPVAFLRDLYEAGLGSSDGLAAPAPAGSMGGRILFRLLERRAERDGTDHGRSRALVDALVDAWIRLSGCVAQNLVWGANRGAQRPVRGDACALDFETDGLVAEVFRGALNEAAHPRAAGSSVGSLPVEIDRQHRFAAAVATVAFPGAELEAAVRETYLGPRTAELLRLRRDLERIGRPDRAGSLMSLAFMREDLRRDPAHANRVFAALLAMTYEFVDLSLPLGQAIDACYELTLRRAVGRLRAVVVPTGGSYEVIWRGLVELIVRTAKGTDPVTPLSGPAFAWLSQFAFRDPSRHPETRLGRLVALLDAMEGLSGAHGDSERRLRRELKVSDDPDDPMPLALERFEPLHNALEVGKLGLLGGGGLENLGKVAGLSWAPFGVDDSAFEQGPEPRSRHRTSRICADVPHLACDAVVNLESHGAAAEHAASVDSERPLAIWRHGGGSGPSCSVDSTAFVLAGRLETVRRIYGRVITYPASCQVPMLMVETVRHQPAVAEPGDTVFFTFTVSNVGQAPSAATALETTFAGQPVVKLAVPPIEPGQTFELRADAVVAAEGVFELTGALAGLPAGLVRQPIEARSFPDLAVTITHATDAATGKLTFTATVRNQGKGAAGPSTLLYETAWNLVGTEYDVPALAPGAAHDVAWSTVPTQRSYSVAATADARHVLVEHNLANNHASDSVHFATKNAAFIEMGGSGWSTTVNYERWVTDRGILRIGLGGRPPIDGDQSRWTVDAPFTASMRSPALGYTWDLALEAGAGGIVSYVAGKTRFGPFRTGWGLSLVAFGGFRVTAGNFMARLVWVPTWGVGSWAYKDSVGLALGGLY